MASYAGLKLETGTDQRIGYIIVVDRPTCLRSVIEIPDECQPDKTPVLHIGHSLRNPRRLFFQCIVESEPKAFPNTIQVFGAGPTKFCYAKFGVYAGGAYPVGVSLQGAAEAPAMMGVVKWAAE